MSHKNAVRLFSHEQGRKGLLQPELDQRKDGQLFHSEDRDWFQVNRVSWSRLLLSRIRKIAAA